MRYSNDRHIDSIDEAKEFFSYLINGLRVSVHPDNDFFEYVETGTEKLKVKSRKMTLRFRS